MHISPIGKYILGRVHKKQPKEGKLLLINDEDQAIKIVEIFDMGECSDDFELCYVMIPKFAGTQVKHVGEDCLLFKREEIMALVSVDEDE